MLPKKRSASASSMELDGGGSQQAPGINIIKQGAQKQKDGERVRSQSSGHQMPNQNDKHGSVSEGMTVSMKNEENTSQRSLSSGSGNSSSERRQFKSNRVLQAKQENLLMRQGFPFEGVSAAEAFQQLNQGLHQQSQQPSADGVMNDTQAAEVFSKLQQLQNKKTYAAKKNWTQDESRLLSWAVKNYTTGKNMQPSKLDRNDWMQIAGFIPGRNDSQCMYKFNQDKKSTIQKSNWVKREDEELIRLIRENGTRQWSQIAATFNASLGSNRNGKQCRERWVNFLNPEIKKDPFSLEEDILILERRLSIGNKWSEIIKEMPGRTENNVKNRFNMMFKNVKDNFIRNKTHDSVFVMAEKCELDLDYEEQFDQEKLIQDLINRKKKELEQLRQKEAASGSAQPNAQMQNMTDQQMISEPLLRWSQQKDFIVMNQQCQNRQQINLAIEKLIEQCPAQINIIKRLVDLVQDDINRLTRTRSCYSGNSQDFAHMYREGTGGMQGDRSTSPAQVNADNKSSYTNNSQDQLMPGTLFNFQQRNMVNQNMQNSMLGAPTNMVPQQQNQSGVNHVMSFGDSEAAKMSDLPQFQFGAANRNARSVSPQSQAVGQNMFIPTVSPVNQPTQTPMMTGQALAKMLSERSKSQTASDMEKSNRPGLVQLPNMKSPIMMNQNSTMVAADNQANISPGQFIQNIGPNQLVAHQQADGQLVYMIKSPGQQLNPGQQQPMQLLNPMSLLSFQAQGQKPPNFQNSPLLQQFQQQQAQVVNSKQSPMVVQIPTMQAAAKPQDMGVSFSQAGSHQSGPHFASQNPKQPHLLFSDDAAKSATKSGPAVQTSAMRLLVEAQQRSMKDGTPQSEVPLPGIPRFNIQMGGMKLPNQHANDGRDAQQ